MAVPPELRAALRSLGQALPTLWRQNTLSRAQRKALLRCLIDKVVLDRQAHDLAVGQVRPLGDGIPLDELGDDVVGM